MSDTGDGSGDDTLEFCCWRFTKCERYIGFLICLIVGVFLIISSMVGSFGGSVGSIIQVTVGNILVIISTVFLNGTKVMWEKMTAPDRIIISILYLASIGFTIAAVALGLSTFWMVLAICLQTVFMIMYVLSYFPGVREWFLGCLKSCCCPKGNSETSAPIV